MSNESKWHWKMDWCKRNGKAPAQSSDWDEAEQAYANSHTQQPTPHNDGLQALSDAIRDLLIVYAEFASSSEDEYQEAMRAPKQAIIDLWNRRQGPTTLSLDAEQPAQVQSEPAATIRAQESRLFDEQILKSKTVEGKLTVDMVQRTYKGGVVGYFIVLGGKTEIDKGRHYEDAERHYSRIEHAYNNCGIYGCPRAKMTGHEVCQFHLEIDKDV